jgi:hypothetical protein
VQVTLQSIQVDQANDGVNDRTLEVYGQIIAQGTDQQLLFNKDGSHHVSLSQGQVFGGDTPIAQAVLNVSPRAGQAIRLQAHLFDQDTFSDDDLGTEVSSNLFETGWRKDVTITLTSGSGILHIKLSMAPI